MGSLDSKIDGKVNQQINLFIQELKQLSSKEAEIAKKNWEDYKPELKKCKGKDEVTHLLISFFQRHIKAVKDSVDGKTFYKFRYSSVGTIMQCMYAINANKKLIKDYIRHIHAIQGQDVGRGIRMADEKQFETPDEINQHEKKKIPVNQFKARDEKSKPQTTNWGKSKKTKSSKQNKKTKKQSKQNEKRSETNFEIILAAIFAIFSLGLFILKLLM